MTTEEMLKQIDAMPNVPDWDSYDALPITESARRTARSIARLIALPPHVGPATDGGIGFEFDDDDSGLSVIVNPDGSVGLDWYNAEPTR